jgi:preprotein translocase subunit SecG
MLHILLVIQIIVAVSMIVVILLQRNASDGLSGLSGGSSGGNSLISGRASANMLTKTTTILAVIFMGNSLAMATITARSSSLADKIIEDISKTDTKKESKDSVPTDDAVDATKNTVTKEVAPVQKDALPKDNATDANKDVIKKDSVNDTKPEDVKKDISTPEKQTEPAVPVSE